jgi:hypothetical protein
MVDMLEYWKGQVKQVEEHHIVQADTFREQALKEIERKIRHTVETEVK